MNRPLHGLRAFLLACIAVTANAELVLQPEGLEPGDRYRLLFATSQKRDATSSNVLVYNEFVQRVADEAPIVGSWGLEWRALISTRWVDARDNIEHAPGDEIVPVYAVDGSIVAFDGGLFFGLDEADFDVSFSGQTELGTKLPTQPDLFERFSDIMPVFTGSNTRGQKFNRPFQAFANSPTGGTMISTGYGGPAFLEHAAYPNEALLHFYAVSEIITAVPEPSSTISCLSILLGAALLRRRRRS